jgi:FkbM family methyltransferase
VCFLSTIKHWARLVLRPHYRREQRDIRRLRRLPKYAAGTTTLLGPSLELVDPGSFLAMYQEIFEREIYRFIAVNDSPRILDCGANVGLSVCYFKRLYPHSRITAFEPDPQVFACLSRNCQALGLTGVELLPQAVWKQAGDLPFRGEGADAGRLAAPDEARTFTVKACRLKEFLLEPVDFLKMDIEGAEAEVLADCAPVLANVRACFVEYHSFVGRPQQLETVIRVLSEAGFRLHVHQVFWSHYPFVKRREHLGMDLQLNIFAFRP